MLCFNVLFCGVDVKLNACMYVSDSRLSLLHGCVCVWMLGSSFVLKRYDILVFDRVYGFTLTYLQCHSKQNMQVT